MRGFGLALLVLLLGLPGGALGGGPTAASSNAPTAALQCNMTEVEMKYPRQFYHPRNAPYGITPWTLCVGTKPAIIHGQPSGNRGFQFSTSADFDNTCYGHYRQTIEPSQLQCTSFAGHCTASCADFCGISVKYEYCPSEYFKDSASDSQKESLLRFTNQCVRRCVADKCGTNCATCTTAGGGLACQGEESDCPDREMTKRLQYFYVGSGGIPKCQSMTDTLYITKGVVVTKKWGEAPGRLPLPGSWQGTTVVSKAIAGHPQLASRDLGYFVFKRTVLMTDSAGNVFADVLKIGYCVKCPKAYFSDENNKDILPNDYLEQTQAFLQECLAQAFDSKGEIRDGSDGGHNYRPLTTLAGASFFSEEEVCTAVIASF